MIVLILNSGSSSIKYQLFEIDKKMLLAKGSVEKIGMQGSFLFNTRNDGDEVKLVGEIVDHQAGIEFIFGVLISKKHGSINSLDDVNAIGHRVVHRFFSLTNKQIINPFERHL